MDVNATPYAIRPQPHIGATHRDVNRALDKWGQRPVKGIAYASVPSGQCSQDTPQGTPTLYLAQ
jgi:hypothetical protein